MVFRIFLFIIIVSAGYCQAQITQLPIGNRSGSDAPPAGARLQASPPIELPFWDDFSTSTQIVDTAWWMPGSEVQVITKPGIGINPPSINVATFDGVTSDGLPYSTTATDGPVDSLLSRPIDMTKVPANLRNTVYISFFFQVKGLGEQPEEQDSLVLYFKKNDGSWKKVWPLPNDPYPTDPTIFTEKFIQVSDPVYYHDAFQFMFRAIGRQNGWFDNWHIDYVYMDKRRSLLDNSYLDRTFTALPSSIFNGYTALPFDEFMAITDKNGLLKGSSTFIRNLEQDIQPVEYTVTLRDTLNDVVIEKLVDAQELLLFQKDFQELTSNPPTPALLNPAADSLFMEVEYVVNSGDKFLIDSITNGLNDTIFYQHIDLKVNDTVRSYFALFDYFAYDDGTAEFGAGINQEDGQLAYQFISETDLFVDRLDIYFPNINRNQAGSAIELFVLDDLENNENSILGMVNGSVQHTGINQFVSYHFNPSIHVIDTFYIGFRNLGPDQVWLSVGLDKNNDTGSKMYSNVTGVWLQNQNITGSLMMRPHFVEALVSGIEKFEVTTSVYPNPSSGTVHFQGYYDRVAAYDLYGRLIPFDQQQTGDQNTAIFAIRQPQIVLLVLYKDGKREIHKLMITP
jgi:hypothetical protein